MLFFDFGETTYIHICIICENLWRLILKAMVKKKHQTDAYLRPKKGRKLRERGGREEGNKVGRERERKGGNEGGEERAEERSEGTREEPMEERRRGGGREGGRD